MKNSRAKEAVFSRIPTRENNNGARKGCVRSRYAAIGTHESKSAPSRFFRGCDARWSRKADDERMSKLAQSGLVLVAVLALMLVSVTARAQLSSRLAEGLDMHTTGRLSKAIAIYTEVIKKDPRSVEAYNWRGMAYDDLGELDRALSDYNSAIRISKKYADVYNNRGEIYRKKKQYSKALEDYSKAVFLEDGFAEAHYNMGLVYEVQKQPALAAKEYAEYLKLNPKARDEMEVQLRINRLERTARSQKPTSTETAKKPPAKRQPGKVAKQPPKRPTDPARKRTAQAKRPELPKRAAPGAPRSSGAEQIMKMVDQLAKETGVQFNPKQKKVLAQGIRYLDPVQRKALADGIRQMDPAKKKAFAETLRQMDPAQIKPLIESVHWLSRNGPMMGYAVLGLYFLMALMLFLVARKTNAGLSWLAFIPIANIYLALRVADKPGWWLILLLFIPVVNIILGIIVAFGIVKARRKSPIWGLLMIIPCTSPFAWLYLGLSR